MKKWPLLSAVLMVVVCWCCAKVEATAENYDLSRGFGDLIDWKTWNDALRLNRDPADNRPVFVLIHRSTCGACKNLKPLLHDSMKFAELSEKFLMVNLEDDEGPKDDNFAPDGHYIPRILFIDRQGQVRKDILNEAATQYKYYYSDANKVIKAMQRALEVIAAEPTTESTTVVDAELKQEF